jgi:hypothetical protein
MEYLTKVIQDIAGNLFIVYYLINDANETEVFKITPV